MSTIRVISSSDISDDYKKKIESVFSKKHKGKVVFEYETDITLVGGLLVIDGENYYDASVRGQLAKIQRELH